MNNSDYKLLCMKMKDIKKSIRDLSEYNNFTVTELRENFKLDDEIIENDRLNNYCNDIDEMENEISNIIIPDISSNI